MIFCTKPKSSHMKQDVNSRAWLSTWRRVQKLLFYKQNISMYPQGFGQFDLYLQTYLYKQHPTIGVPIKPITSILASWQQQGAFFL